MQVFDGKQTAAMLPYGELTGSIRDVLEMKKSGATTAPDRMVVGLADGGTLLVMPASDRSMTVVKTVTVHAANSSRDMPTVQADVLVLDATNGRRLGLLEGDVVTARRTAALTLLAALHLAPRPEGPLLIVGAGVQARSHLEAFVEGQGVKHVYIHSKTRTNAQRLADHAKSLGCDAQAVDEIEAVLNDASLVVTATSSSIPVIPDRVRNDAFVAAIGAYNAKMAELPATLVTRSKIYVDTLEGARTEAGDLIQAGINWDRVTPLEDVFQGPLTVERGPVIFKSVGHALFDLAAAKLAFRT